jgi:plasmid stabilization system protein ParE
MDRPPPRLSRRALADLEAIYEYIAADSLENAATTIARILDEVDQLAQFRVLHKIVGRSRRMGTAVHSLTVPPYIVYYRVDAPDAQVIILTVRHGARQQPKRFE